MPYGSYVEVVPPDLSRTLERSSRLAVRQRVRWCARSGGGNAGGGERAATHIERGGSTCEGNVLAARSSCRDRVR
jgi:hypothetical protein